MTHCQLDIKFSFHSFLVETTKGSLVTSGSGCCSTVNDKIKIQQHPAM